MEINFCSKNIGALVAIEAVKSIDEDVVKMSRNVYTALFHGLF